MNDMQKAKINISRKGNDRTSVPNIFIDQYMKDANGDFVKVYLYLLRSTNSEDPAASVSDIADLLNLTEKDVIRALKYWVKEQVLQVSYDENGEPVDITFLVLGEDTKSEATERRTAAVAPAKTQPAVDKAEASAEASDPAAVHEKKASAKVSRARAEELREQEDVADLFYAIEQYIGRTMNATEMNTVLSFYDHLGFDAELIDYLVQYCVTNHHTSFRYMETVAMAWSDQGIHSLADAKEQVQIRSRNVTTVTKAFGITDRNVTNVEMDFINRWFKEYAFDPQIVTEACQRTVTSIGKANFNYAEKILKEWHEAGIHTNEDLKALDARFKASRTVAPTDTNAAVPAGAVRSTKPANKFNSFSQRTYNFDEMEKSLLVGK